MADPSAPALIAVHCTSRDLGTENCSTMTGDISEKIIFILSLFVLEGSFILFIKSVQATDHLNFSEVSHLLDSNPC